MNIVKSVARYEAWLKKQLGRELVEEDLKKKHEKMAEDPFQFLRATYWRWAETILDVCPELKAGPAVLAVGDIHVENFGTWRDAEGRLVWGVNDFDEAARMPSRSTSCVSRPVRSWLRCTGISDGKICDSILQGYREGIEADPKAFVLDRDNKDLRDNRRHVRYRARRTSG